MQLFFDVLGYCRTTMLNGLLLVHANKHAGIVRGQ